jgi:hypothetical protein
MSTYALTDSTTMLRRNLRRMRRNPGLTLFVAGIPLVLLLLFVYVFGGTLGAGLPGATGSDRGAYADYLAPGMLLFTVVGGAQLTAIGVAIDMTEGIIARFKTMAVWRGSVLAGHVIANMIKTLLAVLLVLAVSIAIGFSPNASALDWLAAAGLPHPGTDLAVGRARPGRQERRVGQQPADVPDAPAVPRQRLRPDGLDARGPALVRRASALHADQRDPARAPDRHAHRQRRHRRARLVRGHHRRQLRLVAASLRPRAAQLVDEAVPGLGVRSLDSGDTPGGARGQNRRAWTNPSSRRRRARTFAALS